MKKIVLSISLFILLLIGSVNVSASSTGHDEYYDIEFPNTGGVKLLINMSNEEKNNMIKGVKRRAFGWSSYCVIRDEEVLCTGDTIFSRSNLTKESYEFTYKLVTGNTTETSYSLSGDLGGKVSGKVKAVSLAFDLSIKGEYDKKEKNTTTETTNFAINIHPNTKVSLVVMVEGLLSNGASSCCFVDNNKKVIDTIRKNIDKIKVLRREKENLFIELDYPGLKDIPVSKTYGEELLKRLVPVK